ncbi:transcriptional regulator [Ezakiella coagulans]|uniref:transcriptional regulator n=1 Tax=Ezakiella coagulans TaxID=46507 RepID=UPI002014D89C|nr:transcriptional regulator [Ezakiella coagulans]UQK60014.1 transcriptional regulator [Ezakiella coagulans]
MPEIRGSGLRKIIEAYESEENYKEELKPEFKSTESSFTTILKNLNYDTQNDTQNNGQSEGQNEGENKGKKLKPKDRRKKIVKLMKENSNITTIELSHILLVFVSTIERDLKILTDEKTIEYIGSAKDGYWKVNK